MSEHELRIQVMARFHALRVLDGALNIWDRWGQSKYPQLRRQALREKAKGIIHHDRFLQLRDCHTGKPL